MGQYADLFEDDAERVNANANVRFGIESQPDLEAQKQALAKRYDVPAGVVDEYRADYETRAKTDDAVATLEQSPKLRSWLAEDANRAKVVHDDLSNLSFTEKAIGALGDYIVQPIAKGTYQTSGGLYGATAAVADLPAWLTGWMGKKYNPFTNLADWLHSAAKSQLDAADSIQPWLYDGTVSQGFQNALSSVQSSLMTAGAGAEIQGGKALTQMGGFVAPELKALLPIGAVTGGQSYQQATDAGLPGWEAALFAAQQGGVEMVTEALPLGEQLKMLHGDSSFLKTLGRTLIEENVGEQIATHWQDLNEWLYLHPEKTLGDYLAERPDAALQTALATTFAAGLQTGTLHLASRRLEKAAQAEQTAQTLQQLNTLAQESKVNPRAADTYQQLIAHMADSGGASQVFVDADALMQSGIADKVAQVSPSIAAQLPQALQSKGQVAIPLAEYQAKIAPTEYAQSLLPHLKIDPEGFSQQEAQAYMQSHAEQLKTDIEQAVASAQGDDTFQASRERVKQTVLDQMNTAGRFTPAKNEADATLVAAHAAVRAAQLGITPEDFHAKYPLKVQAQNVMGEAFDQAAYHGSPHRFDKFDLSKIGTGEGAQAYGHGLYFAESPDVASAYRKNLSRDTFTSPSGAVINKGKLADLGFDGGSADVMLSALRNHNGDFIAAADAIGSHRVSASKFLRDLGSQGAMNEGAFYHVDIPDDQIAKMLDWDKPLSEQPHIMEALNVKPSNLPNRVRGDWTGQELMSALHNGRTNLGVDPSPKAAAEFLNSKGIPGVRYFDGGSRQAGKGTQNTVIWDQSLLDRISEGLQTFYQGAQTYTDDTIEIDGKQRPAKNSNGQPIAQTEEGLRNFWKWFGDSKVVDAEGRPLVVYHGTPTKGLEVFDADRIGNNGRAEGAGFYFTSEKETADGYGQHGETLALYLNIQNPLEYDAKPFGESKLRKLLVEVAKTESRDTGEDWQNGFLSNFGDPHGRSITAVASEAAKLFVGEASALDQVGGIVGSGVDATSVNTGLRNSLGFDGYHSSGYSGEGFAGGQIWVAVDPTQIKSATGNTGEFDPQNPSILHQGQQSARGSFSPSALTISLLKNADLSTFLHESGHFFFETDIDLASQLLAQQREGASLSEGEQEILKDAQALLTWHGLQGSLEDQLDQWHTMPFEEKRTLHERTAESFERYLFEGKAPSIELQPYFQRFRAWLLNVYKALKDFLSRNPEAGKLNDEVRGVFDRMLATTQEIKLAEQGRSMMPVFQTAEQAGMTQEEFAAYHAQHTEATNTAIQDLQAKGLRDMQWLHNAHGREVKRLQKQGAELRRQIQAEVRTEVMSQPVYQAWSFLTRKMTADDALPTATPANPDVVDPTRDSLHTAIAKLGGLNKDEVVATWGTDPADKPTSGVFGKPVWRKEGGKSIDGMAELLGEHGYLPKDEHGKVDVRDLEERFDAELRGRPQYSDQHDYDAEPQRAGDQVANPSALGAGRLSLPELLAMDLPVEVVNALKARRMVVQNGLHPDLVAEIIPGFTSGDELVRKLAAADSPQQEIEARTDVRMLEEHGELSSPEAIAKAADQAIHNDARARFVATEANALAKAVGKPKVLTDAAKQYAAAIVARKKVRELKPGQFASVETKAAKAADKAFKAGDTAQAAAEKRNQVINQHLTKATYDALDEVDAGLRYLRKFDKDIKSLDADYADQIAGLLERFDLRSGQSNKAVDRRAALAEWLTNQRDQGMEPDVPQELLNEAFRTSYKNLTLEEFRGLVDTIQQIEHLGRLKHKLLTAKDQRDYEVVRDEIAASIKANAGDRQADTRSPTTNAGRAVQGLKRFWAAHIKAATYARVMDGGKDGGPMWEYFVRAANERGDQETTMRAEATVKLSEILAPVFKLGRMGGKGVYFPSIDRSLNREARMAIALNVGNEGNVQRLLGGEGWTLQQVLPVLQSLTAQEWQAVQAVWDHFESYRPQIAAKERRVYGKEPDWVEPSPFTLTTADGQTVALRGGYYPIKYDPAASQRAEEHADAEGAKRQLQGAYTSATTRRSFTKSRVEEVNGRPLLYSLAGLYSGVNDVIHDLAWHEWLIDTNKLLRSQTIDAAIRNHYGPEVKQQFKTWAADIAEGEKGADAAVDMALSRLRQGISVSGLGFNVMSAVMQPLGLTQSITRVGATWVGRGIRQYLAHPLELAKEINAKSDFMAGRARTRFRELNELRNQVQDQSAVKEKIGHYAYYLMMRCQQMVDVPTWQGAYEKAIAEGNEEDRAVSLADQAVIDAQGGGQTKDLSAIERGGPAQKLFTVFYSFMNTALNLGVDKTMTANTPAKRAKLAAHYAMLYVVPAVLGYALKAALTPGDSGDDDPDAIAKHLAAAQLDYLMSLMVVVREFNDAAKIVTGTEAGGRDYTGPAGLRVITDAGKFAAQAHQGEFDDAFRKASVNLVGDLFGLPSAQINRTITGVKAVAEGKTDGPVESVAAPVFGFQSAR